MGPSSSAKLVVVGYLVFLSMVVFQVKSAPLGFGLLCNYDIVEEIACGLFDYCDSEEESDESPEEQTTTVAVTTTSDSNVKTTTTGTSSSTSASTEATTTQISSTMAPETTTVGG